MASSLPYSGGQGDNNNVEGEETFEKGRKNYAKNLMPVNVRTLLQHQEPGEPLVVHGQAVGMVSLVGQVRQVTKGTVSLSYLLEDETGRIEAIHYIDEDNKIQPPIINTFVQIIGILKSGQERSMVTVYKLLPVRNMHQVTAHKLEIIVTPLRIAKQQEMASMAALATLNGFHPGFGLGINNSRKWPGSNDPSGRNLVPRPSLMNNNNRLSSGDSRPHFNQNPAQNPKSFPLQNYNQPTINNFNCFSELRDPDMKKVLASIKNCPMAIGLSKLDLLKHHRHSISEKKMSEVIDYLTSEGHIYNTIDEHHFKATDA